VLLALQPSAAVRAQDGLNKRVDELGQQIAAKMTARQKTTVAVVEFTDLQGNTTDFGRFLAEELITRLMETEKFRVIERQLLNKIIAEQKLSLTGVIDPASAKQLGKILGVEAIVAGTVTNLSQSLKVNARLVSTETGEIFSVASAEIFKDESVTGLLANGGGASPAPAPKPTPKAAEASRPPAQRVRDVLFELSSCRRTGGAVICYLSIKNDFTSDVEVSLIGTCNPVSRLFDEFGNEYNASVVRIGSRESSCYAGNDLVTQVATNGAVRFEGVSEQAAKLTLQIVVRVNNSSATPLTFRNIAITK
ncbi:MAG TPA: FlgO family outer membrane protein, partial [Pyrinomonadaceae bacterium]